jgi:hypothetical protein
MPTQDIFKRLPVEVKKPITADMCILEWGGSGVGEAGAWLSTATNFSLNYTQPVTRRRTIGTSVNRNVAVIYAGQPYGTITIQRLFAEQMNGETPIFNRPGWNPCAGLATIKIAFNGESIISGCKVSGGIYTAQACIVTTYALSGEAEGLTVIDNVQIEFLQLEYSS